jgi:4-hydroxy-L-threonine phosphate dehydrogenase PdxA
VGIGRASTAKATIAIAAGDPAGIGPEISLKAALDATVRAACNPLVVADPGMIERHARACGLALDLCVIERAADADWSGARLNLLSCAAPGAAALAFGAPSAAGGRASLAFARAAIKAALAGDVEAVVAAPQNETAIALAGIAFDGYPSFVARETGAAPDGVFLMLAFGATRIAHATLHQSVSSAIAAITGDRVGRVIAATDAALKRMGIAAPKLAVASLNPLAGGLGEAEIAIIRPAIERAAAQGIDAAGPFAAGALFHLQGYDGFVVMLHDQGHIAAKLLAPDAAAALTIGSPILFSSVAHGSAHDIAGKGIASPAAMIAAVLQLCPVRSPAAISASAGARGMLR